MLLPIYRYLLSIFSAMQAFMMFVPATSEIQMKQDYFPPARSTYHEPPDANFPPTPEFLEGSCPTDYRLHETGSAPATINMGPGEIYVPILLYHHVLPGISTSAYSVDLATFETQMNVLSQLGYETITTLQLRDAILNGAQLPAKPIILTFDDGNIDNYDFAFPVMKSYGFTGTIYIVSNRLSSEGFVNVLHLQEMASAGWEIGSHTSTHPALTQLASKDMRRETLGSRIELEESLNIKIRSLAYPYGLYQPNIADKAAQYGYLTAMGLGTIFSHDAYDLYYLARHPMGGSIPNEQFLAILGYEELPDELRTSPSPTTGKKREPSLSQIQFFFHEPACFVPSLAP